MNLFLVFTGILFAGVAWLGARPGIADAPASAAAVWCAACTGYLGAMAALMRMRNPKAVPLWLALAAGLALRGAAWFIPPQFTTDYYRYIWDARVSAAGVNPYRYAPGAPELAALRHAPDNGVFDKINHKNVPTIYGPAAQALFRGARAVLGEDPARWRILFFAADAATVLLLAALLGALGLPRAWCAVYAFHPLVLVDFNAGLHVDAALTALLAASLLFAVKRRTAPAALCLAGASLIKYFPILFLPLILGLAARDAGNARRGAARVALGAAVFGAAAALAYAPYVQPGVDLLAGLKAFARAFTVTEWSPYWLAAQAGGRGAADALMLAGLGGAALWCAAPAEDSVRLERAFWLAAGLALLAPVQRPWYFAWALPLCCVRVRWAWLLMGCLALLTYGVFLDFDYLRHLKMTQYLVFYTALGAELALVRRARGGAAHA